MIKMKNNSSDLSPKKYSERFHENSENSKRQTSNLPNNTSQKPGGFRVPFITAFTTVKK